MTYAQALKSSKKIGAAHASDAELMAMLCDNVVQTLCGAVAPQLMWEGAQKKGLSSAELMRLCTDDPHAAADLMWV